MLSRKLAQQTHWPAIDVLASISRSMNDIVSSEHRAGAESLKKLLAAYQHSEDLISIGAYQNGSNPMVDLAIRMREPIQEYLQQPASHQATYSEAVDGLLKLVRIQEGFKTGSKSV